jgi:hypothetical protein
MKKFKLTEAQQAKLYMLVFLVAYGLLGTLDYIEKYGR